MNREKLIEAVHRAWDKPDGKDDIAEIAVDAILTVLKECQRVPDTELDYRVSGAHEVLAALLHTGIASDSQANPDGFLRAEELGLLLRASNPATTPLGRGLLRALGLDC